MTTDMAAAMTITVVLVSRSLWLYDDNQPAQVTFAAVNNRGPIFLSHVTAFLFNWLYIEKRARVDASPAVRDCIYNSRNPHNLLTEGDVRFCQNGVDLLQKSANTARTDLPIHLRDHIPIKI
ncbi:hypothetical protein [Corynebacterium sp. ES2775-CONJ]|uniref:hypothetical protein n=1 Tax=Corynebacterium sp. ES2775-CONJ TaxID=2974029 RepID=UPI0021672031|nr:hypothetical protein [Corynebacterium sp. ES2775-CONJ]MCS4490628.1 hypothetical protein [Corynebacterium sp. ES2775-CONJ]